MSISLVDLDKEFARRVEALLELLLARGIEMRPYFGLRSPQEQAKLWRQSRSKEEIAAAITRLQAGGAMYLADVLDRVGPQHGLHVTNSLPGLSWHQWGEAVDCFWAVNGRAEWSSSLLLDGLNGYREYAMHCRQFDLDAGGNWRTFKDWPHVQFRSAGSPVSEGLSLSEIDEVMQKRFG